MKIKFNRDQPYECFGRARGIVFKAGEEYSLRVDMAHRWIQRGVAEMTDPEKGKKVTSIYGGLAEEPEEGVTPTVALAKDGVGSIMPDQEPSVGAKREVLAGPLGPKPADPPAPAEPAATPSAAFSATTGAAATAPAGGTQTSAKPPPA